MKTLQKLLHRDIGGSVAFVALAFLSLFFFIDVVEALNRATRDSDALLTALMASALKVPGNLYELAPIAVLIGTIYPLSRMAQASEFTALRTAGLTPGRALRLLLLPGTFFAAVTFSLGEWVVPEAERVNSAMPGSGGQRSPDKSSGSWLKDRGGSSEAAKTSAVHVARALPGGVLQGVRIFEFDESNRLVRRIEAASAMVDRQGQWALHQVKVTDWPSGHPDRSEPAVTDRPLESMSWRSHLTDRVLAAAVLPVETMSTVDLWRYSRHLWTQEQASQRYEIRFWKRALYPLSCLVMVALALPFAYLQARNGGVSLKVFGGVMLGISFILLNHLASHLGLLRDWTPWAAAAAPALLYMGLSLLAFSWIVRRH